MNSMIIGHYSHKNGQAEILNFSEQEKKQVILNGKKTWVQRGKTLYCKKVTYATYMRNLKRLIKKHNQG